MTSLALGTQDPASSLTPSSARAITGSRPSTEGTTKFRSVVRVVQAQ